jgi:hypothetical protein
MSLTPDVFHGCRDQKILVIEPYYYTPEIETGLEIADTLAANNDVTFVGPDALKCTTDETYRFTSRVLINCSRKQHASSFLATPTRRLTRAEIVELANRPCGKEIAEIIERPATDLQHAMYETFDLGMGIRSSLVSLARDPSVDLNDYRDFALSLGRDAVMLYRLTKELIRQERFDVVVLFNGRFASVRAIRRACEAMGTRYFVHERGSSFDKYAIYDCSTPHQPAKYREWVDAWWCYAKDPVANARDFLAKKRRGVATNWYSFTKKQETGLVQPRSGKRRITFFTSSSDEFAAIGDEFKPDTPFCDQATAIRALGTACRERGYELIIRFHPNTPKTAEALMQAARDATPYVIEPTSAVDSYALMETSNVVLSQNSTIALEAAAANKPAFYTGRSVYEHCRSVPRIRTGDDLQHAISTGEAVDPSDALKYANFLGTHGIEYIYYKPNGLLSGTYRGRNLNAPLATIRDLKLRITRGGL